MYRNGKSPFYQCPFFDDDYTEDKGSCCGDYEAEQCCKAE